MERLHTIGETAKLFGISTQTLRYYDKIDLIKPTYVDKCSGYRYYSFDQFHYIDRIKYLQSLGLELEKIKMIISSGNIDSVIFYLEKQYEKTQLELQKLQDIMQDIKWYKDYWEYFDEENNIEPVYRLFISERYILKVAANNESLPEIEIRLAAKRSRLQYLGLRYKRQFGYILDFSEFLKGKFKPIEYFVFLKELSDKEESNFMKLPEGNYLCSSLRILTNQWDPTPIKNYFTDLRKPKLILALEFEDNLVQYEDAKYEIQILW